MIGHIDITVSRSAFVPFLAISPVSPQALQPLDSAVQPALLLFGFLVPRNGGDCDALVLLLRAVTQSTSPPLVVATAKRYIIALSLLITSTRKCISGVRSRSELCVTTSCLLPVARISDRDTTINQNAIFCSVSVSAHGTEEIAHTTKQPHHARYKPRNRNSKIANP